MRAGLEAVADFGFSGTIEWRIYGHAGLHQTVCEVLKQSDDGPDRRAGEALETYWERVELWIDEPGAVTLKLFFASGAITRAEKNSIALNATY